MKTYLFSNPQLEFDYIAFSYFTYTSVKGGEEYLYHDNSSAFVSFFHQLQYRIIGNDNEALKQEYIEHIEAEYREITGKADDIDPLTYYLETLNKMDMGKVSIDYTTELLLDTIESSIKDKEPPPFDEYAPLHPYGRYWRNITKLLIGLADVIEDDIDSISRIHVLLVTLIDSKHDWWKIDIDHDGENSKDGVNASIHYQASLMAIKLSQMLNEGTQKNYVEQMNDELWSYYSHDADLCSECCERFNVEDLIEIKNDESFVIITGSEVELLLYKILGNYVYDIDPSEYGKRRTRRYAEILNGIYWNKCNYDDKKEVCRINKVEMENHSKTSDSFAEILYIFSRYMYFLNKEEKKVNGEQALEAANNLSKRDDSKTKANVLIIMLNSDIQNGKYIEAKAIIKELESDRFASILSSIQRARIEEARARYYEKQVKLGVGRDDLRLRLKAREHYVKAEEYARQSNRTWIYMRIRSEVYRLDYKFNNSNELKKRSSELISYLSTEEAKKHPYSFRKITKNLMSEGDLDDN